MADEQYNEYEDKQIVVVDPEAEHKRVRKELFGPRLIYAIVNMALGLIFIFARNSIFNILGYVTGASLLLLGITGIILFFASKGSTTVFGMVWSVLEFFAGVFCLANPGVIANLAIYVFALMIFLSGMILIYFSIRDKGRGFSWWKAGFALGIILAVLGVLMIIFNHQSQAVISVIVGVSFIISAVFGLVSLALR